MWEALALTLCLGAPDADLSNCLSLADTWGPYDTKKECLDRVEQMKETFPLLLAKALGYPGPIAVISDPEGCTAPGEEA